MKKIFQNKNNKITIRILSSKVKLHITYINKQEGNRNYLNFKK